MKRKIYIMMFVFALVLFTLIGVVNAETQIIDDSTVRIEAPLYSFGSNSILSGLLYSKIYTGGVHMLIGFDSNKIKPISGYETTNGLTELFKICPIELLDYDYDVYNGVFTCYKNQSNFWNVEYTSFNIELHKIFYEEQTRITQKISNPIKIENLEYDNKDSWYLIPNIQVSPTNIYEWNVLSKSKIGSNAKYDIVFFPSGYGTSRNGVIQALQDNNIYILDPFINNSHYEIGNLSNSTNTWNSDENLSLTTVQLFDSNRVIKLATQSDALSNAVDYYSMDNTKTSGGFSISDGSNGNNLKLKNITTGAIGKRLEAYSGSGGSGEYIRSNGNVTLNLGNSFTITGWFKSTTTLRSYAVEIIKENGGTNGWIVANLEPNAQGNKWRCIIGNFGSSISLRSTQTALNDGTFHHWVCSWDGTKLKVYIDGVNGGSNSPGYTMPDIDRKINIFTSNSGASLFSGTLDEIAFYSYNLSQSKINTLYNSSNGYNPYKHNGYNISANTYGSLPLPIAYNSSKINLSYSKTGTGTVSINFTCNYDATSPTYFITSTNGKYNCEGDVFQYYVKLTGTSSTTPLLQNITAHFTINSSLANNTAPVLSSITFNPSSPNVTNNIMASTTYTDADSNNGSVFFQWQNSTSKIFNETIKVNSSDISISTLTSNYTKINNTYYVTAIATDGINNSNTVSGNVTITSSSTITISDSIQMKVMFWTLVIVILFHIFGVIYMNIFHAYALIMMFLLDAIYLAGMFSFFENFAPYSVIGLLILTGISTAINLGETV